VAKLDSTGNWLWAVSAGGTGTDGEARISVDSAGNAYVTGFISGTASFGSTTLTAKGAWDLFVAKLDSTGNWLWAVSAGGTGMDRGLGISVDGAGNSHVTGIFDGSADFGSTTLTTTAPWTVFVAKLDNAGQWLWAVSAAGTDGSGGYGISVDGTGNSVVTGFISGTVSFGATPLTANDIYNGFVAKLDSTGKWLWAVSADVSSVAISVDSTGNSTITGSVDGPASFGPITLTPKGQVDAFVAALDSTGKWLWAVSVGGTKNVFGSGVSLDGMGHSLVTGVFHATADFASSTLTTSGGVDVFVWKLSN
jgi:hypothetical protein